MAWQDWNHEHQASRFGRRGNGAAVGQRVPGHHRRGPRAGPSGPGRGPAGGRVGRAGRGGPVDGRAGEGWADGRAGEGRADGSPPAQTAGPAADRAVRAGRDDRVPAAAQRRGAGGARGHGQPAGGDRAGLRQPAGGGLPGRARDPPPLGRQRGGAGRHCADRRLARARVRHLGADRAGGGGAPGDLPHRAEAAAGPVHRLRGDRLRDVGRHRVCPPVDRVAAAGAVGARGARGRGGHRLGGLPRPGAVRRRVRAVGLRHGADGRRPGHRQPVPGAGRRDRDLAGLAGRDPRAGRADRRGDRAGRGRAGQRRHCLRWPYLR